MNRLVQVQRDHNVQTAGGWEHFSEHRQRVARLLLQPATQWGAGRLCVLGAGNCNDLDLAALTSAYDEVHLIDVDELALRQGLASQRLPQLDRIHPHGFELTGILDQLAGWSPQSPPSPDEVDQTIKAALDAPAPLSIKFSHVASVCLLSQLIHSVVHSVGETHPRFVELMSAVRLRHLRLLGEISAPGGRVTLVTDVVSSDTCPGIASASQEQLPAIVRQAIEQRNFFHGTNPAVLAQTLCSDDTLISLARDLQFFPPWRWNLGPRTYAVYGIGWTRPGG